MSFYLSFYRANSEKKNVSARSVLCSTCFWFPSGAQPKTIFSHEFAIKGLNSKHFTMKLPSSKSIQYTSPLYVLNLSEVHHCYFKRSLACMGIGIPESLLKYAPHLIDSISAINNCPGNNKEKIFSFHTEDMKTPMISLRTKIKSQTKTTGRLCVVYRPSVGLSFIKPRVSMMHGLWLEVISRSFLIVDVGLHVMMLTKTVLRLTQS